MNIREELLAKHSKAQTMRVVRYVGSDADRFAELMRAFFGGPYRVTQRAAWPMNYCVQRHPQLIGPYLNKLLKFAEKDDVHDAVRRNAMRLLQYVEIPVRLKGRAYSLCLDLIGDLNQPVAVKVFAITTARKIAESEPSLMNELALIVKEHLPHNSIAFAKRAREVI
jgi:hypothetical protein